MRKENKSLYSLIISIMYIIGVILMLVTLAFSDYIVGYKKVIFLICTVLYTFGFPLLMRGADDGR